MGRILSAKSLTVRISLVVFLALGAMALYFIYNSYRTYLITAEEQVLNQLDAVAKTASVNLDGDAHQYLATTYAKKDDITQNGDDSVYQQMHGFLKWVHDVNGFNTDLYTLVFSEDKQYFEFIITSGDSPYYRHTYVQFPPDLKDKFYNGGQLDRHRSENGVWLSAFEPIRNSQGEVVAVLMVDRKFNDFLRHATMQLSRDTLISLIILAVIGGFLYRFLRMVVKNEEEQKEALEASNYMMAAKNKAIQDSINYAKRIQDALIPNEEVIKSRFSDSYVFFRGKDVVSGDFPWMFRLENDDEVLLATVDCTGHGVPGALLSIIGYFLLNDIIKSKGITTPARILDELHKGVVSALNQEIEGNSGNDGMDVALVKINLKTNKVEFAGAHRPLVWVNNNQVKEIKGDRLAIGGTHYARKMKKVEFKNHEIQVSEGDSIHFFSDGYPDQIGGPENRRLMTKNMKQIILDNQNKPMSEMGQVLKDRFESWKGTEMQMDDVLVIGIRFT